MKGLSSLSIVMGIISFFALLTMFTSPFKDVEEGEVVSSGNITACENLDENSSFSDTLDCTLKSTKNFFDVTNLKTENNVLKIIYSVLGSVLFLFLIGNIIIPIIEALVEIIPG
ncbi:MAG: hypothetical protein ACLFUH_03980 [Bacteroidales bacterium]